MLKAHRILVSVGLAQRKLVTIGMWRGTGAYDGWVIARVDNFDAFTVGVLRLQRAALAVGRSGKRVRFTRCEQRRLHVWRRAQCKEDAFRCDCGRAERGVSQGRDGWRWWGWRRAERGEICKEVLVEGTSRAVEGRTLCVLRVFKPRHARVHQRERVAWRKGHGVQRRGKGRVQTFKRAAAHRLGCKSLVPRTPFRAAEAAERAGWVAATATAAAMVAAAAARVEAAVGVVARVVARVAGAARAAEGAAEGSAARAR